MKTIVYVDGFNLFYGCLKGTKLRWLNIEVLCNKLLPKNNIVAIRYFTAKVKPRARDPGQGTRQQFYPRALRTSPILSIHFGHFLTNETMMATVSGTPKFARVWKTEEKGSDVNIASHMLLDAFHDAFDVAVLISNDSDLLTPLSMIRQEFGKEVGILNPHKKPSRALLQEADFVRQIRKGVLAASQFPREMSDEKGRFHRPGEWD